MLSAAVALLLVVVIPGVHKLREIAGSFKRAQQWNEKNGHDRAARREYDWYWNSDPEKKSRDIAASGH